MPEIVTALRKDAPHVKVHCSQVDRREIASELASGNLDFALDIPELEKPDLNGVEILQDRYVCVLRQGHPFAKRAMTLDDYLGLQHVMVSSRRRGRGLVDIALARIGRQTDNGPSCHAFPAGAACGHGQRHGRDGAAVARLAL